MPCRFEMKLRQTFTFPTGIGGKRQLPVKFHSSLPAYFPVHCLSPSTPFIWAYHICLSKAELYPCRFEAKFRLGLSSSELLSNQCNLNSGSSGFNVSGQFDSAVRSFAPKILRISAQGCGEATLGRQGLRNQP